MTRCNQDHDLTKTAVKPLSDAELAADRYILNRLLGRGQHHHQLLDKTTLGQAIWVLERIGGSALAEGLSTDDARAKFGIRQLLSAGFETLSDFPRSFDQFLDVLVSRRQEEDLRSEMTAYGPLRYWMGSQIAKDKRCELITELRQAFTRHAKRNVIDRRRVLDGGQAFPGLPLRQAAEQCGLSPDVFVRLSKLLGIRIEADVSGVATLVPPNQLQQIMDQLSALHTMEEVIETLGVRWPRIVDLADQGHLPYVCRPYDRSEPQGKRGDKPTARLRDRDWNRWYFQPDAAENFLSLMRSKIVIDPEADIDDGELVDMLHVTTMFTSFDQVIRLVLAGTLPLRGNDWSRPGLQGLLVSKTEAVQITKLERREGHPLRAAAPLMGMTYNQLRSCINTNLITPVGERKSFSITDDMIEAFKTKYVQAMELAEVFGLKNSRIVIRYMRENGVEPIQVEGELGITLYLRETAMPLAKSLPPPVVFKSARERAKYQKEKGLAVEATRKRYDTPQDWSKRGNDRSGKKASIADG